MRFILLTWVPRMNAGPKAAENRHLVRSATHKEALLLVLAGPRARDETDGRFYICPGQVCQSDLVLNPFIQRGWIFLPGMSVPELDMIQAALRSWENGIVTSEVAGDVLAVQRGDRDAFGSVMFRYQNRLYRYLLRWVRDPAAAEDLFQQTWMRVIQNIHRFNPKRNFDAWLFAVARNLVIDYLRRRQPGSLEEPVADGLPLSECVSTNTPGALEQVLRSERAELVQKALESQPPVYREILSLRFEEEMKLEEIAEVLRIPLGTVKSRLGRALEQLRRAFLRLQLEDLAP